MSKRLKKLIKKVINEKIGDAPITAKTTTNYSQLQKKFGIFKGGQFDNEKSVDDKGNAGSKACKGVWKITSVSEYKPNNTGYVFKKPVGSCFDGPQRSLFANVRDKTKIPSKPTFNKFKNKMRRS